MLLNYWLIFGLLRIPLGYCPSIVTVNRLKSKTLTVLTVLELWPFTATWPQQGLREFEREMARTHSAFLPGRESKAIQARVLTLRDGLPLVRRSLILRASWKGQGR